MNASGNPVISIIVASHRRQWIEELCVNLLDQQGVPYDHEVIIVTDYHNDLLKIKYPDIIWKYCNDRSISVKRNAGIECARGEVIAFTDDDCIPSVNWIQNGLEYLLTHEDVDCVEGYTTIEQTINSGKMIQEFTRLERPGFRTNNIFYRHRVLTDAGLFDTRFSVQREDMDLAFTVLSMGKKIDYCRDIRVTHRFRANECWDLLKNCWNRRFDPLLYRKHKKLYRQYIGSPMPRIILLFSLLWIALILLAFSNNVTVVIYSLPLFALVALTAGTLRTGLCRLLIKNILIESISILVAPIVMGFALVHGSIKFRKLLII